MLNYALPNGATVKAGEDFNVNVTLQNTSTSNWTGDVKIGYKWAAQDPWQDVPNAPDLNLQKGLTGSFFFRYNLYRQVNHWWIIRTAASLL